MIIITSAITKVVAEDIKKKIMNATLNLKKNPALNINHNPSEIIIYKSSDYSLFEMINGNRDLDMNKVKKIKSDVESGLDILNLVPIIVNKTILPNGKLAILDGQHRYMVSTLTSKPVYYVISNEELNLYDIAKINSRTKNWGMEDYANCYSKIGLDDYKILIDFKTRYQIDWSSAFNLLMNGSPMNLSSTSSKFKKGTFKVKHLDKSRNIMDTVKKFQQVSKL